MNSTPEITIKNVSMVYNDKGRDVTALSNVSLEIQKGEFISLLGPSGCGKTTLLRIIADLLQPTSGTIEVCGKTPREVRLEKKYGIEYLIRAFKIVSDKYADLPIKLLIVGGGSLENKLKKITKELKIESKTIFTGKVTFNDVPKYQNMLSVFVALSYNESFGVAVIEASACEKPVVVSNVGGLPEVVEDGVTGIVVPPGNPEKTAEAIEKLILNENLRKKMGKKGRERVKKYFNWDDNIRQMIRIYKNLLRI